jgi:hypothetical protein
LLVTFFIALNVVSDTPSSIAESGLGAVVLGGFEMAESSFDAEGYLV